MELVFPVLSFLTIRPIRGIYGWHKGGRVQYQRRKTTPVVKTGSGSFGSSLGEQGENEMVHYGMERLSFVFQYKDGVAHFHLTQFPFPPASMFLNYPSYLSQKKRQLLPLL